MNTDKYPFSIEDLENSPVEHYLGYHTKDTMSYEFVETEDFTLVTSNEDEANEASYRKDPTKNAFVWFIEGRKIKSKRYYYLQEVFRPTQKAEKAKEGYYAGAKKKFDYYIEGEGIAFRDAIPLDNLPWFADFKKRNGNFGFGLRLLRDEAVKSEFLRLTREFLAR